MRICVLSSGSKGNVTYMEANGKKFLLDAGRNYKYINDKYTLVFIDEAKWNLEKEKYINNLKNKHKYEYIEETIKNTSPKTDINDIIGNVFDIEKVEIE